MEIEKEKIGSAIMTGMINLMKSNEMQDAYRNADDATRTEFSQAIWNMMRNSASVQVTP